MFLLCHYDGFFSTVEAVGLHSLGQGQDLEVLAEELHILVGAGLVEEHLLQAGDGAFAGGQLLGIEVGNYVVLHAVHFHIALAGSGIGFGGLDAVADCGNVEFAAVDGLVHFKYGEIA